MGADVRAYGGVDSRKNNLRRNGSRSYRTLEEAELIDASLKGDLEAWGEIFSRYRRSTYNVAYAVLEKHHDAEDAIAIAFDRAHKNLGSYDPARPFSTWIFTIARNTAINILHKNSYRRTESDIESLLEKRKKVETDIAETVEEERRKQLIQKEVRRSLSKLDPKYRYPLSLYFYGDYTYPEISKVLGIPVGTVKTRIHRGKAQLESLILENVKNNGYLDGDIELLFNGLEFSD